MSGRQKKPALKVLERAQVSQVCLWAEGRRRSRAALWPCRCGALPPLALQRRSRSSSCGPGQAPGASALLPAIPGSRVCSAGRVNSFTCTRLRMKWVFDWRVRCSLVQRERSFTNPSSDEFSTPPQWPGSPWSVRLICAYPRSGEDDSLTGLREHSWINLS